MVINRLKKWMLMSGLLLVSSFANAGLQAELNNWLSAGGYGTYTNAGVYHNQYGGYWTGGALSVRTPNRQVGQLFSYTPPHFSGGCSGIDMELGGFNFVNKDEIVQQLRAIGQNAKMLAYNLAIKYVSSLLADTMDWVKDKADFLNQLQMDSCTAAQNVLSAGFSAMGMPSYSQINDAQDREICIERQVINGGMTRDQAQASCGRGGSRPGVLAGDPEHFTQGNLAWYVLMQSPVFQNDPKLAQWIMNLTGTIVLNRNPALGSDGSAKANYYPGMLYVACETSHDCLNADGKAVLNALIGTPSAGNASVAIWQCQNLQASPAGCAQLSSAAVPVSLQSLAQHNLAQVLTTELTGIMQKLANPKSALNSQEKALIEQSAMPLYRYVLASQTFFHSQVPDPQVKNYLRMLSQHIVATNIESLIGQARLVFGSGNVNSTEDAKVKMYLDHLEHLGAAVASYEVDAQTQMQAQLSLMHDAQLYEQALVGRISSNFISAALFQQGGR